MNFYLEFRLLSPNQKEAEEILAILERSLPGTDIEYVKIEKFIKWVKVIFTIVFEEKRMADALWEEINHQLVEPTQHYVDLTLGVVGERDGVEVHCPPDKLPELIALIQNFCTRNLVSLKFVNDINPQ